MFGKFGKNVIMDTLIEALLWLGIVSGVLALLGLAAEGIERGAARFDTWIESICTRYADDGDI